MNNLTLNKKKQRTKLVAQACNSSYSGSRDQEDHGLKPAQGNSSGDPISKNPLQKRHGGVVKVVEHLL
jgi:hypothetical protein